MIRTAARAFNERGYHHTSLDDIAADLGLTKPTVYYYVANKEQLLFECFLAGLGHRSGRHCGTPKGCPAPRATGSTP